MCCWFRFYVLRLVFCIGFRVYEIGFGVYVQVLCSGLRCRVSTE